MNAIPLIELLSGESVPTLGMGTWTMGASYFRRKSEVRALRLGLDLGMRVIDTAEMYSNGGAESIVGKAIAGRRDEAFVVSKVLPKNASREGTIRACEQSLKRLRVEQIDLYLLHWRLGDLESTVSGFNQLLEDGKIRNWGVSNFSVPDMKEVLSLTGGSRCATNQVLYNLRKREVERETIPWCKSKGISIMAYSPLEQGKLFGNTVLVQLARKHNATEVQIILSWILSRSGVIAIPRTVNESHIRENSGATKVFLDSSDHDLLDREFPLLVK